MRWTILACGQVTLLLQFVSECSCNSLLLLKQRLRLEHLFNYEVSQCLKSASPLSPGLWSVSDIEDTTRHLRSLTSVRSVAKSIAFATSPVELVDIVRDMGLQQPIPWTIEYECLAPFGSEASMFKNGIHNNDVVTQTENLDENNSSNASQLLPSNSAIPNDALEDIRHQRSASTVERKSFSSKTLFCSLSQCINGAPALDTRKARVFYYIFETLNGFHFCSSTEPLNTSDTRSKTMDKSAGNITPATGEQGTPHSGLKELWAGRPFIFSAALNIEIASAVMNILNAKLKAKLSKTIEGGEGGVGVGAADSVFTVLDPCCGSGTILMMARR